MEYLGKDKHKGAGCQVEGIVHLDIDAAYHPTDDGIVEDGNIESYAHDVEADEVALGEETFMDYVIDHQNDACDNGEVMGWIGKQWQRSCRISAWQDTAARRH